MVSFPAAGRFAENKKPSAFEGRGLDGGYGKSSLEG